MGKMRKPCCDKHHNNRGAWSKQEDQKLIDYIQTHGEGCWRSIPKAAGLHRCGKSCRLRWTNYLRPDIKRGDFDQDEEDLIIKLHALLGNRWSLIAGRLPGRTDNEVKNYWNSHLTKKLMKMGIDPNNHRLNQVLPRPQPHYPPISSMYKPENCADDQENSDRVSETASCFEDESTSSSKLNLDLTIAVPKSPDRLDASETKQPNLELPTTCEVLESKPVPTLLLFH